MEVEVGFKIKEDKREAEKLLLAAGFEEFFKAHTRDIYFGKETNFDGKSEQQIKHGLIRLRNFEGFDNLKLLDDNLPNKMSVDFNQMIEMVERITKSGFKVVFDTQKSDWIYKKGECYHQLQDIKYIGLLDYVYDEEIFDKSEDEQFQILSEHMRDLGLNLEYELGVDKLRSLYCGELKFSKNQNGAYNYQK